MMTFIVLLSLMLIVGIGAASFAHFCEHKFYSNAR